MSSLPSKFAKTYRQAGVVGVFRKAADYVVRRLRTHSHQRLLRRNSAQHVFSEIYKRNTWGDSESISGSGSTLKYTENLRAHLPALIEKYAVRSVYDAPCGDFNWMRYIVEQCGVTYVGADIVEDLIESNKAKYSAPNISFLAANITSARPPAADLWICRDCLFHLSYRDILSVLTNFVNSGVPWLLTTTHINSGAFENRDILTGDYRLLDLFSAPFCLSRDPVARIDDWIAPYPPREMCMWSNAQIASCLDDIARRIAGSSKGA